MAVITGTDTVTEYLEMLKGALRNRNELFKKSIKPGADIVADYCKAELKNLTVDDTPYIFISQYNKKRGLSQKQKEGLILSMGLAPLKKKQALTRTDTGTTSPVITATLPLKLSPT